jgi:hypothetical protein
MVVMLWKRIGGIIFEIDLSIYIGRKGAGAVTFDPLHLEFNP